MAGSHDPVGTLLARIQGVRLGREVRFVGIPLIAKTRGSKMSIGSNCVVNSSFLSNLAGFCLLYTSALGVLADQLGFGLDELMACGDGLNDIPMLACAGLAVAMDNAYPETKAHADWIAPSNEEDGVAAAVDRFVFGGRACC